MKHSITTVATITSMAFALFAGTAAAQRPTVNPITPRHPIAERIERSRPVPISGRFMFPVSGNCNYTANVRGTARPVGNRPGSEPLYTASGFIDASVRCPGRASIQTSQRLSTPRPMTLSAIEQAIESRGSLVTDTEGRHCVYVPNFTLTSHRLEGMGASLMCPTSGQDSMRGGGPASR